VSRIVVNYWRSDSDRWVRVEFREHRPMGGLAQKEAREADVPRRVKIEESQAGSSAAFEQFLRRETYGEDGLVVFAYPDAWDKVLRRLDVEYPLPERPRWWKAKQVYAEKPPAG
jgi:hypothetical protein